MIKYKMLNLNFIATCLFVLMRGTEEASYNSAGCFDQTSFKSMVNGDSMSVDFCASKCRQGSKPYAGIGAASSCYCADEFAMGASLQSCNYTCSDSLACGGISAINQYSSIDNSVIVSRNYVLHSELSSFQAARGICSLYNGDLVAQMSTNGINSIVQLAQGNNNTAGVGQVWIGLRKRKTAKYEWVSEVESIGAFAAEPSTAYTWDSADSGLNCVTLLIGSKTLKSVDCNTPLAFVCFQTSAVTTDQTTSPTTTDNSKSLALFIILPIFLFCYCTASIIYCVRQIFKLCCYNKKPKAAKKEQKRPPTPGRPLSGKRAAVYPIDLNVAQKVPLAYDPTIAEAPMTKRDISLSIFDSKPAPAYQDSIWPSLKAPVDYKDDKKARLLENAAQEARDRKQNDPNAPRIASADAESRPESARSTTKLLSGKSRVSPAPVVPAPIPPPPPVVAEAAPTQNLAGMSINEILRQKMAQQKKVPKIINA